MSDKIKFSELVKAFSEAHNITQQKAESMIRGVFGLLLDDLENEGKASITNFGSFELKEVAQRTGINPQTGEEITIPAHKKVSFKPFKALEETVNAPFAHLESKLIEKDSAETKTAAPIPTSPKEDESDEKEEFEDPFESVIDSGEDEEFDEIEDETEEEEEKASIPPPIYKAKETEDNNSRMMWVLIILLLAIVGVGGWYFFLRDSGGGDYKNQVADKQPPKTEQPVEKNENPTPPAKAEKEVQKEKPTATDAKKEKGSNNKTPKVAENKKTPENMTTYIIKKDEWMWDISRKVYGKAYLWPLIFESNKTVSDDPNLVEPAKTLIIPSLDGNASALTKGDYAKLAQASRIVSEAYGNTGNQDRAAEYLRFSKKYERLSK